MPSVLAFLMVLVGQAPDGPVATSRTQPLEPADARASFQVPPGFELRQVAAEPLVSSPVATCFDADGRLYVAEMGDYPFEADRPGGRVVRLDDDDRDGVYDRRTVFLDGVPWPTGLICAREGLFITAAPDILFARDTNGDGRADERQVVFHGFGTQNVQALVNSLIWGQDGFIHGASGGNGGLIESGVEPERPSVSVRGQDFRFRVEGTGFEAESGGGQFGLTFDDWCNRFNCSNSNHIRQIVFPASAARLDPGGFVSAVALDIAAEGPAAPVFRISPAEPWRVIRTQQRAADPAFRRQASPTELVATGFFTSATGITVYRGSAFPATYRGNVFIGDVGGNLVHRKRLEAADTVFRAVRADEGHEFLASTDTWFRPVSFANTPRGTLLIVDMYRETIEHPVSIPEPIQRNLDLRSGRERGRLYELVPASFNPPPVPKLAEASVATLVEALQSPNGWTRDTAQRLLLERQAGAEASLLLEPIVRSEARPEVRVAALCTLGILDRLNPETLSAAAGDGDPRVRAVATEWAVRRAPGESENHLILRAARDSDAQVRLQAAFGLNRLSGPAHVAAIEALMKSDPGDPWIRQAILAAMGDQALPVLGSLLAEPGSDRARWVSSVSQLVGLRNEQGELGQWVGLVSGANLDHELVLAALSGLEQGLGRSGIQFEEWLASEAAAPLRQTLSEAVGHLKSNDDGSESIRAAWIGLAAYSGDPAAADILANGLNAQGSAVIEQAYLRALFRRDEARAVEQTVSVWPELGPARRREALELMLARPRRATILLNACENGRFPVAEIEASHRFALQHHADPAVRRLAETVLKQSPSPAVGPAIEAYRPDPGDKGDIESGKRVFERVCAGCHRAGSRGQAAGPDLETVATRDRENLLIHILDPNREVAPTGIVYVAAMKDGRVASGLLAAESGGTIQLRRADGATETLARADVESLRSTGVSLMPVGLESQISRREMVDLIGFIQSLAGPPAPKGSQ